MHNLPVEEQHPNPAKGNGQFLPREKLASESRISSDRSLPTAVFFLSGRKGPDRNFRPLKNFFKNFWNSCHILRSGYILKYNPQKEEGDWGSEQARGLFREGISLLVDSQLHRKQGICIQIWSQSGTLYPFFPYPQIFCLKQIKVCASNLRYWHFWRKVIYIIQQHTHASSPYKSGTVFSGHWSAYTTTHNEKGFFNENQNQNSHIRPCLGSVRLHGHQRICSLWRRCRYLWHCFREKFPGFQRP